MPDKPNILLITTDEQRFETYGTARSDWPALPNLTRLRREGTTLTNTYSNCPLCMPARYTWMTGLYGSQTERGPNNGYDWPDYYPTMPQALQRAGYHTAMVGKLHAFRCGMFRDHHMNLVHEYNRTTWGFDTLWECSGREFWSHYAKDGSYGIKGCAYTDHLKARGLYEQALQECIDRDKSRRAHNGMEPYRPGVLEHVEDTMDGVAVEHMCEFIDNYDDDKPFYLHASFFAPHYPLDVPTDYFNRHRPEDMPAPHGVNDPELIRRWQENRAMYMALNDIVDELIGKLLDTVEKRGLLDNTVILFSTDHGDMLGDHHFPRKRRPHEGSARTPIIVRAPDQVPADVVLDGLVESADLPQTILEIAGLTEHDRAQALPEAPGHSFWRYVQQGGPTFRGSALVENGDGPGGNLTRALRKGDWKYIHWSAQGHQLHNLADDPGEEHNRIDDPACAEIRHELQAMLIERIAEIRIPPIQGRARGDALLRELEQVARATAD